MEDFNLVNFFASLISGSSYFGVFGQVVAILSTVGVAAASAYVNWTETPKDDKIYAKFIYPAIEFLALVNKKAKQKNPKTEK